MTRVLLIRHGESAANGKGFFAGHLDVPLSERGEKQAELTGAFIAENYSVEAVYSSDLERAYDTAKPLAKFTGKEIENWKLWENIRTGEKLEGALYKDYSNGLPIEPVTKTYWNGWAGSLNIGIRKDNKVVSVGSLSGLTEEVLSNWKDYIGKIAEITGMEIMNTDNKGIRHPKFVRWRADLTVEDTDWYRVFGE